MIKKPQTTDTLRDKLNRTKSEHNNRDYSDWLRYRTDGDEFGQPMTTSRLAVAFGVSRVTIYYWISIDELGVTNA